MACTISGTCHREGKLARVNSFNNISHITLNWTRNPHNFISAKNMSDGYMSLQRHSHITTYRYFFAKERKKPLIKLTSRARFAIAEFSYLFRTSHAAHAEISISFVNLSDTVVRCTVCGTCHHEGSLARVNSFNNLCYISLTHRHGSLGVRASNVMTIS